jgi:hypothetical protein
MVKEREYHVSCTMSVIWVSETMEVDMQVIAIHPNSQYQTVASIFCQTHHMHRIAIKAYEA